MTIWSYGSCNSQPSFTSETLVFAAAAVDELAPLVRNANSITKDVSGILKEVNKKNQLTQTINNLANIMSELNKVIPQLTHQKFER